MKIVALIVVFATVFVLTYSYIAAFLWIMRKGSPVSEFIISVACVVFCLVMAWTGWDEGKLLPIVFLICSPYYLWRAIKSFNKLVPTKESK
jgi:hypothetical protein